MSGPAIAIRGKHRSTAKHTSKDLRKLQSKCFSVKSGELNSWTSFISGFSGGTNTGSKDDCTEGTKLDPSDFTPDFPRAGEKPNDLLQRLFSMWPGQLTSSYRPTVTPNPEATAEFNLRYIRDLYPSKPVVKCPRKTKAGIMAIEAVLRLDKKSCNLQGSNDSRLNLFGSRH